MVIPVEMVQFLLKLLLNQVSCCAPRFPLMLTAKFHYLYVKESEILEKVGVRNFGKSASEILESSEPDISPPTPQPWLGYDTWF